MNNLLFITAPVGTTGRDQHMAIHLLFFFFSSLIPWTHQLCSTSPLLHIRCHYLKAQKYQENNSFPLFPQSTKVVIAFQKHLKLTKIKLLQSLVSKGSYGHQQSHPIIWFGLKNLLINEKIEKCSEFSPSIHFWKSFVFSANIKVQINVLKRPRIKKTYLAREKKFKIEFYNWGRILDTISNHYKNLTVP